MFAGDPESMSLHEIAAHLELTVKPGVPCVTDPRLAAHREEPGHLALLPHCPNVGPTSTQPRSLTWILRRSCRCRTKAVR
jgi:hypothetical protein